MNVIVKFYKSSHMQYNWCCMTKDFVCFFFLKLPWKGAQFYVKIGSTLKTWEIIVLVDSFKLFRYSIALGTTKIWRGPYLTKLCTLFILFIVLYIFISNMTISWYYMKIVCIMKINATKWYEELEPYEHFDATISLRNIKPQDSNSLSSLTYVWIVRNW